MGKKTEPPVEQKLTPVHSCPDVEKHKVFSENVSKAIKPRKKSVNESNEVALIKVHLSKEEVNRKVRTTS